MRESNSDARWLRKLMVAGAMLGMVSLGACKADLTAPTAASPLFDGHRGDHHDDDDEHEGRGTGRSGSAAMTVVAAIDHDGVTEVLVTTYRASDVDFLTPVGCIKKVQVKALDGDRHHDDDDEDERTWTRNYNRLNAGSSYTVRLTNVRPGAKIKVKVLVGCIDGRRTDVVKATATVIRRTDPAVTSLAVPDTAFVNLPVLVNAYVRDLNGQQGAVGNCYLFIGNSALPADTILGVRVPAVDSVPCSFAPSFSTTGLTQVRVQFGDVVPRDDNSGNNSRSGSVTIVTSSPGGTTEPPPPTYLAPFVVSANLYDDTVSLNDVFAMAQRLGSDTSLWNNSMALWDTTNSTTSTVGNVQWASFDGTIWESVAFPLVSVSVSQSTGPLAGAATTTYHTQAWANVASNRSAGANAECADLLAGPVTLVICSYLPDGTYPYGRTTISYVRNVSAAATIQTGYFVDFSSGTASACNTASTSMLAPCYTISTPQGAVLTPYGAKYTFNVVVETATRRFTAVVNVPLSSAPLQAIEPYTCERVLNPANDPIPDLIQQTCQGFTQTGVRKSGLMADMVAMSVAK